MFGKILLISGNEEFLADRTRARAIGAVTGEQPECEVANASAAGLGIGELAGLISPSLFSTSSALVLTELESLPDPAQEELIRVRCGPHPMSPSSSCTPPARRARSCSTCSAASERHRGQGRGAQVRARLRCVGPNEPRDLGAPLDEEAASPCWSPRSVRISGALAGAADQLASTIGTGDPVTVEVVRRYFGGRADVRGFEIADAAIDERINVALEQARWAEAAKGCPGAHHERVRERAALPRQAGRRPGRTVRG